jgi:hypothetical protein
MHYVWRHLSKRGEVANQEASNLPQAVAEVNPDFDLTWFSEFSYRSLSFFYSDASLHLL